MKGHTPAPWNNCTMHFVCLPYFHSTSLGYDRLLRSHSLCQLHWCSNRWHCLSHFHKTASGRRGGRVRVRRNSFPFPGGPFPGSTFWLLPLFQIAHRHIPASTLFPDHRV